MVKRAGDLAALLADAVTRHATPVGSGTVAHTERIPIHEWAEAAVIAWMRHQTTAYGQMTIPRIKGRRRETRRLLAEVSRQLLEAYRAGRPVAEVDCPLRRALPKREDLRLARWYIHHSPANPRSSPIASCCNCLRAWANTSHLHLQFTSWTIEIRIGYSAMTELAALPTTTNATIVPVPQATTHFAPAGRDFHREFARKAALVEGIPLLRQAIDAMPNMVVILNDKPDCCYQRCPPGGHERNDCRRSRKTSRRDHRLHPCCGRPRWVRYGEALCYMRSGERRSRKPARGKESRSGVPHPCRDCRWRYTDGPEGNSVPVQG